MTEPGGAPPLDLSTGDALVVGASRGVGLALARALAEAPEGADAPRRLFVTYRGQDAPEALRALGENTSREVIALRCELTDDRDLAALSKGLGDRDARLVLTLHAAGILHDGDVQPEKALDQCERSALLRLFEINAIAPLLLARAVIPQVPKRERAGFAALSAMVGSIGDNRIGGWYGYRASKAALNQFLRTLAVEARRTHPGLCVTAIHPGTTDTDLSKPFQGNVPDGKLYTPAQSAARILEVVRAGGPERSGQFLNWTGETLPW